MGQARIVFLDIETSPNLAWVWGKWQQDVIQFKQEWEMLSFAYKWETDRKVTCMSRRTHKSEKSLVKKMWDVVNEADVIVAHNGDSFDLKKLKAKFVEHHLPPPSPYKSIDTLKIAKSCFKFNSNRLDDVGRVLGLGRKLQTGGFDLWLKCMAGDKKAWKKMEAYNKQDVTLLQSVYKAIRAWAPSHPNLALLEDKGRLACPVCRSSRVQSRGYTVARTSKRRRMHCTSCGHWYSSGPIR